MELLIFGKLHQDMNNLVFTFLSGRRPIDAAGGGDKRLYLFVTETPVLFNSRKMER